jgi:hypothetical protein
MRGKTFIAGFGVILIAGFLSQTALAQPVPADQLKTIYKAAKLAPDSTGLTVVEPGTVLSIQKGGVMGVPYLSLGTCAAKVQDGELHAPGGVCAAMAKATSRFFQVGEKVYPQKIDVAVKKEQISIHLVACDSCNGTNPPTFFKSEVQFQFAKGYLETATLDQLQSAINQVLSLDKGDAREAQEAVPPAAAPAASPAPEAAPAPIAAPPSPADQPPPTIELGQTIDQVVAALGQPQKIAKVGAKQLYFFKDLKITFTDGKVSDIQ